jgi:AAA+ ATPase superfamily predicted ATPase
MKSPFEYDKIVSKEHFYGRADELSKLFQVTQYSNNLLIHSKRRMGKSSLIQNFLQSFEDDTITLHVDIFDITTKEEFAKELLKALSNYQKTDIKKAIQNLTSLFKRVRVEPTIDPNTLEYSIKPIIATLSFEQMMEEFFNSIEILSKEKKIIIAIDEFQQIANLTDIKLDAFLRKYIQTRTNTSYIFLGSKRHLLTSLFEYKAPLYEMAEHFELQPLKINDIYTYSSQYLKIELSTVEYIYEKCDGETKTIQHILHLLYLQKELQVTIAMVDVALQEVINSKDASYRLLFDTLNNNQKTALKIVAKYQSGFFANEILDEYRIKKQTLQSSVEALFKKELIDKNDKNYFIPDRTFELWLQQIQFN